MNVSRNSHFLTISNCPGMFCYQDLSFLKKFLNSFLCDVGCGLWCYCWCYILLLEFAKRLSSLCILMLATFILNSEINIIVSFKVKNSFLRTEYLFDKFSFFRLNSCISLLGFVSQSYYLPFYFSFLIARFFSRVQIKHYNNFLAVL